MMRASFGLIIALVATAFAAPAAAAFNAPTLVSVGQTQRHPSAEWTLPQYVEAQVVEVAKSPQTASDGSFFTENRVVFDLVNETDTRWLYNEQLAPGTYYVHVKGWDDACFHNNFQTECGSAWSNVLPLTIPLPPPLYVASVKSTHPVAIRDKSRNWTYRGDRIRASFQDARALVSTRQPYAVCVNFGQRRTCKEGTLLGRSLSYRYFTVPASTTRKVVVSWLVAGRVVASRAIWVYE
jgi:hypothetical protein